MTDVMLVCGRLCSGKSTYARELAKRSHAVILSCDRLMKTLFPADGLGDDYQRISDAAKKYLLNLTAELTKAGIPVVLDWGFWRREERQLVRVFLAENGLSAEWHELRLTDAAWQERIRSRNQDVAGGEAGEYAVDENLLAKCLALYEPPEDSEMDVICFVEKNQGVPGNDEP